MKFLILCFIIRTKKEGRSMETIIKEGKDAAEILAEILKDNKLTEDEIVYTTKQKNF